jgi:hypothetical protein
VVVFAIVVTPLLKSLTEEDSQRRINPTWPERVNVVEVPLHNELFAGEILPPTVVGLTVIASVRVVPPQPAELVSVTVTFPLELPKVTVIVLLSGPVEPEVMLAPLGTVHEKVEPAVPVTL